MRELLYEELIEGRHPSLPCAKNHRLFAKMKTSTHMRQTNGKIETEMSKFLLSLISNPLYLNVRGWDK